MLFNIKPSRWSASKAYREKKPVFTWFRRIEPGAIQAVGGIPAAGGLPEMLV
jgi:hypothetical protein